MSIDESALMTSARTETGSDSWGTPRWLFDFLNRNFGPFTLDPFTDGKNSLCADFFTEDQDALKQVWTGNAFCNPPYSKLHECMEHAFKQVFETKTLERATFLIPARTDTQVWHDFAALGLVFLMKGRLAFVRTPAELELATEKWFAKNGAKLAAKRGRAIDFEDKQKKYKEIERQPAPFPSAVVVFDRNIPCEEIVPGIGRKMNTQSVHWTEANTKESISE
jgi:phage N-6-adenine-methyltransferase